MIERFIQIFFWIRIWISPTLIGGVLGLLSYINLPPPFGLIIGIIICILCGTLGVTLAEKARKNEGTVKFMSKVSSTTPDNSSEE